MLFSFLLFAYRFRTILLHRSCSSAMYYHLLNILTILEYNIYKDIVIELVWALFDSIQEVLQSVLLVMYIFPFNPSKTYKGCFFLLGRTKSSKEGKKKRAKALLPSPVRKS